jgi:hypothetical protein
VRNSCFANRRPDAGSAAPAVVLSSPADQAQEKAEIWNIHVSDRVVSPSTRRSVARGHGKI